MIDNTYARRHSSTRSLVSPAVHCHAKAMALIAKSGRLAIFGGRLVLESEVPHCGIARFDVQALVETGEMAISIEVSILHSVPHKRLCLPNRPSHTHTASIHVGTDSQVRSSDFCREAI